MTRKNSGASPIRTIAAGLQFGLPARLVAPFARHHRRTPEPIEVAQTRQGTDQIPYTAELDELIGRREFVDAACESNPASDTTWCDDAAR